MRKFYFEKQPSELFTIGVDFENDLDISLGEVLSGVDVSAIDMSDGSDASNFVLEGEYGISNSLISQKVKEGEDGKRYKITFKVTTSAPHVFEAEAVMSVGNS